MEEGKEEKDHWEFSIIALLIGACVTHPLDLVRVNVQANAMKFITMRQVINKMLQRQLLQGFYFAFPSTVSKVLVQGSLRYIFYTNILYHTDSIRIYVPLHLDRVTVAGISGVLSSAITTPFNKISICMQSDLTRDSSQRRNYKNVFNSLKCMYLKGGMRYLYAGTTFNAAKGMLVSMNQLVFYNQIEYKYKAYNKQNKEDWKTWFIASATASSITAIIFTPLDVASSVSMNTEHWKIKSPWETIKLIYAVHGYRGFFKGLTPSIVRIVPHTFVITATYDILCSNFT